MKEWHTVSLACRRCDTDMCIQCCRVVAEEALAAAMATSGAAPMAATKRRAVAAVMAVGRLRPACLSVLGVQPHQTQVLRRVPVPGAADAATLMTRGRQRFERLVTLAARWDLPVVVHAPHGAAGGALEILQKRGIERAVFHWHKAPEDVTRRIVDAGYLISVTPEVVYRERDRELVAWAPLSSLLVESDAPWQYSNEFAGLPSGPWFASRVAEEVAKIKALPVDDVMFALSTNACRLFDLVWA
jgi:hypothetical protein